MTIFDPDAKESEIFALEEQIAVLERALDLAYTESFTCMFLSDWKEQIIKDANNPELYKALMENHWKHDLMEKADKDEGL